MQLPPLAKKIGRYMRPLATLSWPSASRNGNEARPASVIASSGSGKRTAVVENDNDRRSVRSDLSSRSVMPRVANVAVPLAVETRNVVKKAPRSHSVHSGVSSASSSKLGSVRRASAAQCVNYMNGFNENGNDGVRAWSRETSERGIPPRAQLSPVDGFDGSIVAGSVLNSAHLSSTQMSSASVVPNRMSRQATRPPQSAHSLDQFLGLQGEVRTPELVARVHEICRRPAEAAAQPFVIARPMDPEPRHEPLNQHPLHEFAPKVARHAVTFS